MSDQRWRKVRRAGGYKVARLGGRVRSVDRALPDGRRAGGVELTPFRDGDGYWRVNISGVPVKVATIVLEAFAGPAPYGTEACHGPKGRDCDCADQLRWDTHRENERDKRRKDKSESEGGTCQFCSRTRSHGDVQ